MFNALTPAQLLMGIGRTLRMAADAKGVLEGYERSQVLSAYSVTRLYASEQQAAAGLLGWTRASLAAALDGDDRPEAVAARSAADTAADGAAMGEAIAALLAELPREDATRTRVHAVLRGMIDREVSALDTLPE